MKAYRASIKDFLIEVLLFKLHSQIHGLAQKSTNLHFSYERREKRKGGRRKIELRGILYFAYFSWCYNVSTIFISLLFYYSDFLIKSDLCKFLNLTIEFTPFCLKLT